MINEAGKNLIKKWESCRLTAYKDPVGIPTIGWGNTQYENGVRVKMGDKITQEQADKEFLWDIGNFERQVLGVVRPLLTQNQLAAVVSFVYNNKWDDFIQSTLLKKLNTKDFQGAADEFPKWKFATQGTRKRILPGLVARRADERELFLTP